MVSEPAAHSGNIKMIDGHFCDIVSLSFFLKTCWQRPRKPVKYCSVQFFVSFILQQFKSSELITFLFRGGRSRLFPTLIGHSPSHNPRRSRCPYLSPISKAQKLDLRAECLLFTQCPTVMLFDFHMSVRPLKKHKQLSGDFKRPVCANALFTPNLIKSFHYSER
ncbi:hypothetical protein L596_002953 [Steinernema carpocapsae]|uniref:Uncharacterized protein n=1 Tax=Steinernema carpocapsae TaxID=34508 RepID=A0A4U8UR63_STECR|nr:hypothetical protein L596_002953 [Steinernema carpocapsae]